MLAEEYVPLRDADVRAGSLADLTAAAEAIRALTDTVALPVMAADIRTVLWATFEYGVLEQLADEGKAANFTNYPAGLSDAQHRQVLIGLRTTLSFLNSGTTVKVEDTTHWQAILTQIAQFVSLGVLQQGTSDAIAAQRTQARTVIGFTFNEHDLSVARVYDAP